jgi:hypothetical protein
VCGLKYCDFVVWTETVIIQERITIDYDFYDSLMADVKQFFVYGILPELIGKWYTRQPIADNGGVVPEHEALCSSKSTQDNDKEAIWCFCSQPNYGNMIGCSNDNCTIQWFHFDCLRIRRAPKGDWYCPSCRKLPRFNKSKKNNNSS